MCSIKEGLLIAYNAPYKGSKTEYGIVTSKSNIKGYWFVKYFIGSNLSTTSNLTDFTHVRIATQEEVDKFNL